MRGGSVFMLRRATREQCRTHLPTKFPPTPPPPHPTPYTMNSAPVDAAALGPVMTWPVEVMLAPSAPAASPRVLTVPLLVRLLPKTSTALFTSVPVACCGRVGGTGWWGEDGAG